MQVKSGLHAEVEAIKYILDLVSNHRLPVGRVAICSDCTEAIQSFRKGDTMGLYSKIQSSLFDNFLSTTVSLFYVSRELNMEADTLAKEGLDRGSAVSYWEL